MKEKCCSRITPHYMQDNYPFETCLQINIWHDFYFTFITSHINHFKIQVFMRFCYASIKTKYSLFNKKNKNLIYKTHHLWLLLNKFLFIHKRFRNCINHTFVNNSISMSVRFMLEVHSRKSSRSANVWLS